jgi:predicted transposase/invertase (TIGR01784 family)
MNEIDKINEMLGKSKIDGGNIMETLAQQLRNEGRKIGIEEGMKEGKLDTARELIKRGVDIDIIAEATGFSREELEELTEIVH